MFLMVGETEAPRGNTRKHEDEENRQTQHRKALPQLEIDGCAASTRQAGTYVTVLHAGSTHKAK